MTVAILVTFAGYTLASYGWLLLKGYDVTFKEWVDPLSPYTWPSGGPGKIPAGQVYP